MAVESACPCLRRGTFCSHRKYPKDAQEAAWFLDFLSGRQARVSVGRGLNFASSSLNTVVSTDSRPLRDRQSGHFLANAETILYLRPLAKFSKRVGCMITTFPAWGALRISKPWFWRRFFHTFCRCWQKVCRRRHEHPNSPAKQQKRDDSTGIVPLFTPYAFICAPEYPARRIRRWRTRGTASA